MPEKTRGKFSGLKDKLSFPRKTVTSEIRADEAAENLSADSTDTIVTAPAKYKQLLDSIVINGLLNIAEDKLSDDGFIESVFSKAYELLPVPVRLVVRREWCLSYLQSRKAPLLTQLQHYRAGRKSTEVLPVLAEAEPTEPPLLPPSAP